MSIEILLEITLVGIATLAIYTFLIRENILYRAFEHLFIGIARELGNVLYCYLWNV
jgi:hypothetical protein